MRESIRFINFVKFSCVLLAMMLLSCKGRTMENMEPTGDTVEVVILQDVENNE